MATRKFAAFATASARRLRRRSIRIHWPGSSPIGFADLQAVSSGYSDKAEVERSHQALLTRELFGFNTDWEKADTVDFSLPRDEHARKSRCGAERTRCDPHVQRREGELACERGRLSCATRAVRADVMVAREKASSPCIRLRLPRDGSRTPDRLVLHHRADRRQLTNWYRSQECVMRRIHRDSLRRYRDSPLAAVEKAAAEQFLPWSRIEHCCRTQSSHR